jgi:hypothetical protein
MEYLLVFGVTVAIAGFSVAVFGGTIPIVHDVQGQQDADQIAAAAGLAAVNGTSSLVIPLDGANVTCSGETVHLTGEGGIFTSPTDSPCSFTAVDLNCVCSLEFSEGSYAVTMEVRS